MGILDFPVVPEPDVFVSDLAYRLDTWLDNADDLLFSDSKKTGCVVRVRVISLMQKSYENQLLLNSFPCVCPYYPHQLQNR